MQGPYIQAWSSNNIHHKVWDEITYLFQIFKGYTVEHVITYPCWD